MNERILNLAEQAGWMMSDEVEGFNTRLEKFAELIVRECTERLLNDVKLTDIRTSRCVASINEHFGVEE